MQGRQYKRGSRKAEERKSRGYLKKYFVNGIVNKTFYSESRGSLGNSPRDKFGDI